jgi:hypothetical protein
MAVRLLFYILQKSNLNKTCTFLKDLLSQKIPRHITCWQSWCCILSSYNDIFLIQIYNENIFLIQTDLPSACAIGLLRLVEIAKNDHLFTFDSMWIQDKNLLDIGMIIIIISSLWQNKYIRDHILKGAS